MTEDKSEFAFEATIERQKTSIVPGEPNLQMLGALFDNVTDRVQIYRPDLVVMFANRASDEFLGEAPGYCTGRSLEELVGKKFAETAAEICRRALEGETVSFPSWNTYADGRRRYVHNLWAPCFDADGKAFAIISVNRDMTEEQLRQEELRAAIAARNEHAQINSEIARTALDAFVLADEQGRIIDFNPAAEALFGYRKEGAVGKLLSETIIPHEHRGAHELGMARYTASGESRIMGQRLQLEALNASGTLIPIELTINEVKLPDRRVFAAHVRDLRDARKAQSMIETQRSRIHQIEKLSAMGSLLAGVAHELNNPLAILVAQATLLKEKAASDDVRQRAERIRAAAERAGRIVKSFLAMAREKPPTYEATDLNKLIEETLEILAYGLRSAGVEVTRELADGIPESSVDSDMMRQVLANIVLNAQQALTAVSAPRKLALRTYCGHDFIRIEIEDNGPGVPPDVVDRIFDPFFTTKAAGVGTGIGLSISRNIVNAHEGTLELVPRDQGGALFRITLPLTIADAPVQVVSDIQSSGKLRVLIVDDERDVGESLAEMIMALGHEPHVFVSALAAKAAASSADFDVLFTDFRMPEMSGTALIEAIGSERPKLAANAVLVTGDTVHGPAALLGRGANFRFMEKPFSFADVRKILSES